MSLNDSLTKMYDIQKMLADYRFRSDFTPTEVAAALLHYLRKLPEYDRDIAEKLADAFDLELQLADARQIHAPNSSHPTPSQVTLFELGLNKPSSPPESREEEERASTKPPAGNAHQMLPALSGMIDLAKLPQIVQEVEAALPKEGSSDEDQALKATMPDVYEELMSVRAKVEALHVRLGPLGRNGASL